MKIIICSNVYPPNFIGGAELVTHQQARVLQSLGHDVIVFAGEIGGKSRRYKCVREKYDSLDVCRVHLSSLDYQANCVNFFHEEVEQHFSSLLAAFSPDVVHMHNIIGLSVGLIHLSKKAGAKTVLTLHDHWGVCHKNTLINHKGEICQSYTDCDRCMSSIYLENDVEIPIRMRKDYFSLQAKEVDMFISPSRYLAEVYIAAGFPPEKVEVVWNGIDVKRYSVVKKKRAGRDKMRFTFIGHFGRHKGIYVLLDALTHINKKFKFRVNLVGIGEELDRSKQYVNKMGLQNSVVFWGRISNDRIKNVFRKTDVLVLPSIWPENHPGVITEAMSSHTPVIASNIGGIPEIVEDGTTGCLFEPGNARQLAQKMESFLVNRESIRIFGENAFNKIENNTFENHIEKILRVYSNTAAPQDVSAEKRRIVVCAGRGLSKIHTDALRIFMDKMKGNNCLFVLYNWLTKDQICETDVCWILDETGYFEEALYASQQGIPLLVPKKNAGLRNFCRDQKKGLYYSDPYEAALCLKHLIMMNQ